MGDVDADSLMPLVFNVLGSDMTKFRGTSGSENPFKICEDTRG